MEDNRSTEPVQMDIEHRKILPESLPVLHNQKEFSMASFFSATTESDYSHSHLPEEKIVSDCLKCSPQKPVVTSLIGKPMTQSQSNLLNKIICKQDLECTALQNKLLETTQTETLSPAVSNKRDVIGSSEDEYIKILDYSPSPYKEPSMHKSMLWNSFQISSGISSNSFKGTDFGILHETLPEEVGHLSLNSSSSTEANFKLEPNSPMHSGIFPEDVVRERRMTPKSDLNLQSISSRYEALKKSLSKKMEEINLSHSETPEGHKPELSPTPSNMQADNMCNFLDTHDLHIDYTKSSLRTSLSPLIKFSPVEQRPRIPISCSHGELPNLKGKIK